MIDFEKELDKILDTDPLGLLNVKPKGTIIISADERLVTSFEEINTFVKDFKREPKLSRDISERKLFSRLKGIRENPAKAASLMSHDTYGLLKDVEFPEPKKIKTIEDVLQDDVLGLLDDNNPGETESEDIFNLKNIPKAIKKPDYVAKRKPCREFDQFERIFKPAPTGLPS